jgi:hypothetical protein
MGLIKKLLKKEEQPISEPTSKGSVIVRLSGPNMTTTTQALSAGDTFNLMLRYEDCDKNHCDVRDTYKFEVMSID